MDVFGNNSESKIDGYDIITSQGGRNIDSTLTTTQTVFNNSQELITKAYADSAGGGSSNQSYNYTFKTVFAGAQGTFNFNGALPSTATQIRMTILDEAGNDILYIIERSNSTMLIIIKSDDGTNTKILRATSFFGSAGYRTVNYTFISESNAAAFNDNQRCSFEFTFNVFNQNLNTTSSVEFVNMTLSGLIRGSEGSESTPSYSFFNNNNTGMYSSNLNNIDFATSGQRRLNINNNGLRVIPSGIASSPAYSFSVDPNTGMYLSGPEELSFSASGQARMSLLSGGGIDIRNNRILNSSTTHFNTMFGSSALTSITSGQNNTAYGYQSLQNITDRSGLTAVGYRALRSNTSGLNNTAVGYRAGNALTTSNNLTAFGYQACYNTNGFDNLGIGAYSCGITSGDRNTCVGNFCGDVNSTGSDNTMIGYLCRINSVATVARSSGIGSECVLRSSNEIVLGDEIYTNKVRSGRDNAVTLGTAGYRFSVVYAGTGTINTSDATQKIIDGDSIGLDHLMKLRPVKYKWIDGLRSHYGFLAQDFETLIKNGSLEDSGIFVKTGISQDGNDINVKDITDESNIKRFNYGLRYSELIAPMVKSIQELNNKVEELTQKVKLLESK